MFLPANHWPWLNRLAADVHVRAPPAAPKRRVKLPASLVIAASQHRVDAKGNLNWARLTFIHVIATAASERAQIGIIEKATLSP
jgi:hypothetical protein